MAYWTFPQPAGGGISSPAACGSSSKSCIRQVVHQTSGPLGQDSNLSLTSCSFFWRQYNSVSGGITHQLLTAVKTRHSFVRVIAHNRAMYGLTSFRVGDVGMDNRSVDISSSIFRRTVTSLNGQIAMSGKMLDLLIKLDGRATVREIAQEMNISLTEIRPLLSKLVACGVVEEAVENIPPQFFGYMVAHLSRIAGPMAQFMVEDAVMDIGGSSSQVPKNRSGELIEMLAGQIPNQKQKTVFIKAMLKRLQEI